MITRLITYILFFLSINCVAQKYNFVNWTVEDGLIQSQAAYICQDNYRQLWIATEGGISKFDGRRFTGYTSQDGLTSNKVTSLLCDSKGNIWAGTNYGISIFNGKAFKSIKLTNDAFNNVTNMVQMPDENVFVTNNLKLFKINNFIGEKISVSKDTNEIISSLFKTKNNNLLAFVIGKGLYQLQQSTWTKIASLNDNLKTKNVRKIFITSKNDTLLATNDGLYQLKFGEIKLYNLGETVINNLNVFCITEDAKKNIWIGADNGAYKFDGNTIIHFNSKSGLSDNTVYYIYNDLENNLWFATDADGIYKFRENTFTYYDKSSGLSNTIVMGVAQTSDGKIYAAGYVGGLYKLNDKNDIEPLNNLKSELADSKISSLYADDENNIIIGTSSKGTWAYNEKTGLKKIEDKNNPSIALRGAICFLKDAQGNLLIGTQQGLYVRDKNETIKKLKTENLFISALKQFNNDSVIVGTSKGVFVLDGNYQLTRLNKAEFNNSSVLCLAIQKSNIFIGTTDKGVLNWNLKTDKIVNYNTNKGLPSNFIYSIYVSEKRKAWIGSGFGISNLQLDADDNISAIKNYGRSDGLLGMECSHNCLLKAKDSSLWFGTTKGLFHFNPYANIEEKTQPIVLLKSVKLFSSDITDSTLFDNSETWFKVPNGLKLHSTQNHLTFEFGAIYFTNPEDVLFKCKLEGIDKDFTITNNPYIIYSAIPPGKYTLNVQAITKSGVISSNNINYSFEIEKAFYQTRYFQLLVVLLLISTGALITYASTRRKQKRKEVLEKIREEEFMKLRHRTAEDFHDEMGNRLTRISVLTDILNTKLEAKESDVTKLVGQIKENTAALYNGSRDIIWSLNSENDGIYQIAEHIKEIGDELYLDSKIDFECTHTIKANNPLKLKLDYSRNLIMIFKEAYSNILKHSKATEVRVSIELKNNKDLEIKIKDNGLGFDSNILQKGNGIKNMKNRSARMNGEIFVNSTLQKGTEISISLKNIFI
ncbi:MAG: two-component regulator propeller domain-containing protein [Bacteroidota bacterium]|nr:two-component regulator propeller domain-containing protein [Bacteroidota bacterium]MDP3146401.1 two-component regulator propeller domain-containing protein [Bacteroidota bacterium]